MRAQQLGHQEEGENNLQFSLLLSLLGMCQEHLEPKSGDPTIVLNVLLSTTNLCTLLPGHDSNLLFSEGQIFNGCH